MNSVTSHQDKTAVHKPKKAGREPYPVHLNYNMVRQNNQEEILTVLTPVKEIRAKCLDCC